MVKIICPLLISHVKSYFFITDIPDCFKCSFNSSCSCQVFKTRQIKRVEVYPFQFTQYLHTCAISINTVFFNLRHGFSKWVQK